MALSEENEWRDSAACLDVEDHEIFFPKRNKLTYKAVAAEAKSFCHGDGTDEKPGCPVLRDCLWNAIVTNEEHGILGGMSHRERNALVRKWEKHHRHEMTLEDYILHSEGAERWQQSHESAATN